MKEASLRQAKVQTSDANRLAKYLPPCGRPPDQLKRPTEQELARYLRRLHSYLRRSGRKLTPQRRQIVQVIITSLPHMDAKRLFQWIKSEHSEVSRATFYRCIRLLCDAHVMRESFFGPSGLPVYELAERFPGITHRGQIVCLECGHIFSFHDSSIQAAQSLVTRRRDFRQVNHRSVIYARCELLGTLRNRRHSASSRDRV